MRVFSKLTQIVLLTTFTVGFFTGCGGSNSRNDQGVSFTATGYRTSDCMDNLSGDIFPIGSPTEPSAASFFAGVVMLNNLSVQFVRVDRAFMEYRVAGSSIDIPDSSAAIGGVATEGGGELCAPAAIVPSAIFEFLNLNRNSFPELPYILEINTRVSGITSSGDRIETNPIAFFIELLPDNIIPPTPDDDDDTGTVEDELEGEFFEGFEEDGGSLAGDISSVNEDSGTGLSSSSSPGRDEPVDDGSASG